VIRFGVSSHFGWCADCFRFIHTQTARTIKTTPSTMRTQAVQGGS
jgi:hypothetical protein